MFLREVSTKNKDGSTATYVQLVHNQRNSNKGHAQATVLYNFGRKEFLDIEQLKRLVKSIARFLPPEDALESQVVIEHRGRRFKWNQSRSFGGSYVLSALWQQLNFNTMLEKCSSHRQFTTPIIPAIFAMVANRCLAPRRAN